MEQNTALSVTDTHTTTALAAPSVLNTRSRPGIPVGGKIRPGIMVLTSKYKNNEKAVEIYNSGVAQGMAFGAIQAAIMKTLGIKQGRPMTPKNVPYFTVRASDFVVPDHARMIMDKYGEDRGDGNGRQLYRFPVFFPMDDLEAVMPHALRCFTSNELVYWSEYAPDGTRLCMTRAPVDVVNGKARRSFGGRKTVTRDWNGGVCDPDKCPEYQTKKCNLSGQWVFFVPGLSSAAGISLASNSFYAMEPARELLMMIMQARGRISGLHQGKPLFWFSKVQDEVSMIDPDSGKAKRVRQWIIKLSADVDMQQVFLAREAQQALPAGASAAAALSGPTAMDDDDDDAMEFDAETGELMDADAEPEDAGIDDAPPPPAMSGAEHDLIKSLRSNIAAGLGFVGLDPQQFSAYAVRKWGPGWATDPQALEKALDEVNRGADTPHDYRDQVILNADGLGD